MTAEIKSLKWISADEVFDMWTDHFAEEKYSEEYLYMLEKQLANTIADAVFQYNEGLMAASDFIRFIQSLDEVMQSC